MVSNKSTFNIDDLIADLETWDIKELNRFAYKYGIGDSLDRGAESNERGRIGGVAEILRDYANGHGLSPNAFSIEEVAKIYSKTRNIKPNISKGLIPFLLHYGTKEDLLRKNDFSSDIETFKKYAKVNPGVEFELSKLNLSQEERLGIALETLELDGEGKDIADMFLSMNREFQELLGYRDFVRDREKDFGESPEEAQAVFEQMKQGYMERYMKQKYGIDVRTTIADQGLAGLFEKYKEKKYDTFSSKSKRSPMELRQLQNRLTVDVKGTQYKPSAKLTEELAERFNEEQLLEIRYLIDLYNNHTVIENVRVIDGKIVGNKIDVDLTWNSLDETLTGLSPQEFMEELRERYSTKTIQTEDLGTIVLYDSKSEQCEDEEFEEESGAIVRNIRTASSAARKFIPIAGNYIGLALDKATDFAKNHGRGAAALLIYGSALALGAVAFTGCEDDETLKGVSNLTLSPATGYDTNPGADQNLVLKITYNGKATHLYFDRDTGVNSDGIGDADDDCDVQIVGAASGTTHTVQVPSTPGTHGYGVIAVAENYSVEKASLNVDVQENIQNITTDPTASPHSGKILIVQNGQVQVGCDVYGPNTNNNPTTPATVEVIQDADGNTGTDADQTQLGTTNNSGTNPQTVNVDFNAQNIGLYNNLFVKYTDPNTNTVKYYPLADIMHRLFPFSELEATSLAELQNMITLDQVSDPVSMDPATSVFALPALPGTGHSEYEGIIKVFAGTIYGRGFFDLPNGHNHADTQQALEDVLTQLGMHADVASVDNIRGAADNANTHKGLIYKVTLQNTNEMYVYVTENSSVGVLTSPILDGVTNAVNQIVLHNIGDVLDENTINTEVLTALSHMLWIECLNVTCTDPDHNAILYAPNPTTGAPMSVGAFNGGALINIQRWVNPGQGDISFLWGYNSQTKPADPFNINTYINQKVIIGGGPGVPGFPIAEFMNGDGNSSIGVPVPVVQPRTIFGLMYKTIVDYNARN